MKLRQQKAAGQRHHQHPISTHKQKHHIDGQQSRAFRESCKYTVKNWFICMEFLEVSNRPHEIVAATEKVFAPM
jgi:hypothetical protein